MGPSPSGVHGEGELGSTLRRCKDPLLPGSRVARLARPRSPAPELRKTSRGPLSLGWSSSRWPMRGRGLRQVVTQAGCHRTSFLTTFRMNLSNVYLARRPNAGRSSLLRDPVPGGLPRSQVIPLGLHGHGARPAARWAPLPFRMVGK